MMWYEVQRKAKSITFALGFVAVGAWGSNIWNKTASLPYLHKRSEALAVVQTKVIPTLKKQVAVERNVATKAQVQAIVATSQRDAAIGVLLSSDAAVTTPEPTGK